MPLPSGDHAALPSYPSGLASCVSWRGAPPGSRSQRPGRPSRSPRKTILAPSGGQRPSVATGGRQLPQLPEEIEHDGAAIGREVEAQDRALVHADGD